MSELDALERVVTALMRRLGDRAAIGEIAARAGCTLPAASILLLEHLQDAGPRRVSQIAECQNVGMPAVTPRLKDLERDGFVTRSADPSDARVSLISLSDAGREVLDRLRAARCAVLSEALNRADRSEIASAAAALEVVERALRRTKRGHPL
jgi:DNA-binding MarR family transcriptional regulator